MSDFCNLCGYDDINIEKFYNEFFKPTVTREQIESLDDDRCIRGDIGICESCGLVAFGSDKNFDVWGFYVGKSQKIIGHINKETMELIIDVSEDPFYIKKHEAMDLEITLMLKEWVELYNMTDEEFFKKIGTTDRGGWSTPPPEEMLEKYGLL